MDLYNGAWILYSIEISILIRLSHINMVIVFLRKMTKQISKIYDTINKGIKMVYKMVYKEICFI